MSDLRTAAQQALERLRKYHHGNGFVEDAECIAALEAALAQQAEPWERRVALAEQLQMQQAEPAEPETCTWHQDGDSDSGVYATSCGHYFNLEDGTPEDNKLAWCCYCGKKLAQELITEDEDDRP